MTIATASPKDLVLTRQGLRFHGRLLPCSIGKGGISRDKREGDGATPAGVHRIAGMLYRPDRLSPPSAWARPIARFHVHTCTLDSPGALSFYRRSGFTPVRQQIEIAADPRVTGDLPREAGAHIPLFED